MTTTRTPTQGQVWLAEKIAATLPGVTLADVLAAFARNDNAKIIAWKRQTAIARGERPESGRGS